MGLKHSLLGKIIFLGGLSGFITAVTLQFVPSSFIYPLIVMGKPTNLFTVPAFFPIMFEFTVLISAFTATFGMLIMNGLPRLNHPMFNWERFKRVSDDKFFCVIEESDPKFAAAGSERLSGITRRTQHHQGARGLSSSLPDLR